MVARPRWEPLAFALLARLLSVDGGDSSPPAALLDVQLVVGSAAAPLLPAFHPAVRPP